MENIENVGKTNKRKKSNYVKKYDKKHTHEELMNIKLSDSMIAIKFPLCDIDLKEKLDKEAEITNSKSRNMLVVNILRDYFDKQKKNLR